MLRGTRAGKFTDMWNHLLGDVQEEVTLGDLDLSEDNIRLNLK